MKLYRIVHEDYSSFYNAFSGVGAALGSGRWNGANVHAIYSSTSVKTAVAEKGFYSIINNSYALMDKQKLTSFDIGKINNVSYVLVEAEFEVEEVKSNSFIDSSVLSLKLKDAGLPDFSPSESTFSPWQKLPAKWTSRLGTYVHSRSEMGCVAYSARLRGGRNYIFYNDNYLFTQIKLISKEKILLSVMNPSGTKKWARKGSFSQEYVHFECVDSKMTGIVQVQNKSV